MQNTGFVLRRAYLGVENVEMRDCITEVRVEVHEAAVRFPAEIEKKDNFCLKIYEDLNSHSD